MNKSSINGGLMKNVQNLQTTESSRPNYNGYRIRDKLICIFFKNVRHETIRYFRGRGEDYLNRKISECETTVSTGILDSCSGINELKQGQQPKTKLENNGQGVLLEEFHSILNRCKSHFCQLFNLHGVNDVKQLKYTQLSQQCQSQVSLKLR